MDRRAWIDAVPLSQRLAVEELHDGDEGGQRIGDGDDREGIGSIGRQVLLQSHESLWYNQGRGARVVQIPQLLLLLDETDVPRAGKMKRFGRGDFLFTIAVNLSMHQVSELPHRCTHFMYTLSSLKGAQTRKAWSQCEQTMR